ncbi:hypothetical protein ACE6H2_012555 [Prunus campanulata]
MNIYTQSPRPRKMIVYDQFCALFSSVNILYIMIFLQFQLQFQFQIYADMPFVTDASYIL